MVEWADHRRWKVQVVERHPDVLDALRRGVTHQPCIRAAHHPRWKELGLDASERSSREKDPAKLPDALARLALASPQQALEPSYSEEEDMVYNDYNQYFVDSGLTVLPGSWVQNVSPATRFSEYPKLRRLLKAKAQLVASTAIRPTYHCTDLYRWIHGALPPELAGMAYDVIVLDPPLASYRWDEPSLPKAPCWSWEDIAALPIPQLAARDSFVFLWVGSGTSDGLERGREVLAQWGYRRCEDIVWIRTNDETDIAQDSPTLLRSSVQHCLMGIRGTVVRSTDSFFVHCNVDADVILWPGEPVDASCNRVVSPLKKPHELYTIAENFCLGTRRLELFGTNRNLRRGWLTVGAALGPAFPDWAPDPCFPPQVLTPSYATQFVLDPPGCPLHMRSNLLPYSEVCEELRPKTPPGTGRSAHKTGEVSRSSDPTRPVHMGPIHVPSPLAAAPNLLDVQHMLPYSPMPYATYGPAPFSGYNALSSPLQPAWPSNLANNTHCAAYPTPYIPSCMDSTGHSAAPFLYSGWGSSYPVAYPAASTRLFQPQPPRSALLGQGAGGRETVSTWSGSERFSGAQNQVLQRELRDTKK